MAGYYLVRIRGQRQLTVVSVAPGQLFIGITNVNKAGNFPRNTGGVVVEPD